MSSGWCVKGECSYLHPECRNRCKEADKQLTEIRTKSNHPDPRMNWDLKTQYLPRLEVPPLILSKT